MAKPHINGLLNGVLCHIQYYSSHIMATALVFIYFSGILQHYPRAVNPFPNKPWFLLVCSTSLENTVGKGEIAQNEQFLLFPQCFLPSWRTFGHEIAVCKLFQFGRVLNLLFGKELGALSKDTPKENLVHPLRLKHGAFRSQGLQSTTGHAGLCQKLKCLKAYLYLNHTSIHKSLFCHPLKN